jgi:hypothetical protein
MDYFKLVKRMMRKERSQHVREIAKIDAALAALGSEGTRHAKRTLSAAARKRIGDAQRKRWAKTKRQKV